MSKVPVYTAIFLDGVSRETLLKAFPPIHPKVLGHHVTLVFKPSPQVLEDLQPYLEKEAVFEIVGYATDSRGQALKVTVPEALRIGGQVHHLTLSCAEGTSPVYSNALLREGWSNTIPRMVKGVVRHFTG